MTGHNRRQTPRFQAGDYLKVSTLNAMIEAWPAEYKSRLDVPRAGDCSNRITLQLSAIYADVFGFTGCMNIFKMMNELTDHFESGA